MADSSAPQPATALLGAADVFDLQGTVYIKVDVPGLTKADIKVRVVDGNLQVSGSRAQDASTGANFFHVERQQGHFTRVFQLPATADLAKITAACDHGVLTIAVPKADIVSTRAVAAPIIASGEDGDGSLNAVFAEVPISVFPKPSLGKLVILDSNTPIIEAVKTLAQYHVLAAPVRDTTQSADATWSEKYLGFLDMVSIVTYMLEKLEPGAPEDFEKEAEKVAEFKSTTVGDVMKMSRVGPFVPVDFESGKLLDAMFLCGQHALRRVAIVQVGGDIVNIVTQSALVQTLSANLERFSAVGKQTLLALGLGTPAPVHSVTTDDKLHAAFKLIKDNDVSAVPVVDSSTGKICGNISARDVRLVAVSNKVYKLLNMPIRVYLDVVSDGAENSAITCTPEDTLEEVIKRLVRSRIHRIYVVDGDQKVIRVVSLRNIVRKFVKEPIGYFGHFF